MSDSIRHLATFFMGGFAIVAFALGYWQIGSTDWLARSGFDPRLVEEQGRAPRGGLLDRTGAELAATQGEGVQRRRVYASPALAHVTGYFNTRLGVAGLEQRFDPELRGASSRRLEAALRRQVLGGAPEPPDVVLTIDARLQAAAAGAMGDRPGAVVVLDPRSGEVLVLLSQPYFDANHLDRQWDELKEAEADPLFNRATQATYTPGSTFKMITAAAALDLDLLQPEDRFRCTQAVTIEKLRVDCRNSQHVPQPTFKEAFAWSSNRVFAETGLMLGFGENLAPHLDDRAPQPRPWRRDGIERSAARLEEYAGYFGFGRDIPFELPVTTSRMKTQNGWTPDLLAQTAFGQGELAETPLLAALGAASIANGGKMPAPLLAKALRRADGETVSLANRSVLSQTIRPETAAKMNELMVEGVRRGYGAKAAIPGVQVAGKTGTAEVGPSGPPHSWFIGYAPADAPRLAIALVAEHGGSSTDVAAPLAGQILRKALELYQP